MDALYLRGPLKRRATITLDTQNVLQHTWIIFSCFTAVPAIGLYRKLPDYFIYLDEFLLCQSLSPDVLHLCRVALQIPINSTVEGNRGSGEVLEAKAGAAWMAVQGAAQIVPAAVLGTRRTGESVSHVPGFGRRVVVDFGIPVPVVIPEDVSKGKATAQWAERIQELLSEHVSAAQKRHGIPLPEK